MADCDDPNHRERISLALIPIGCAIMDFLRSMRRPGATTTAGLAVALAVVAVAKETKFYSADWWEPRGRGEILFLALTAATSLGAFFVAIGFRRVLIRENRESQFQTAAESFARLVRNETSMNQGEFGVNIWLCRGLKGFRQLIREAQVADPRNPTPITWTKGKGVIGQAWDENRTRVWDLDYIRQSNPTEDEWCSLARSERWRLSWGEFEETSHYHAVLAVPLRRHRFGRYRVRGVAAIDALVGGKADELDELRKHPDFRLIRKTCEAAFAGDPRKK